MSIKISVQGEKPVPWGCNEWDWRRVVAKQARQVRSQIQGTISTNAQFSVALIFLIGEDYIGRTDLDNLAKPVLDTLFQIRNAQVKDPSLTGALFDVDDDQVFKLNLEKRLVSSEEEQGVEISIVWEQGEGAEATFVLRNIKGEELMGLKTQGVYELVRDVLKTFTEPYGEDVIEDVCLAIEENSEWRQRYEELSVELRAWVVNNWIGQYTKQITGMKTLREVVAKRSKLIKFHTKLGS